MIRCFRGTTSRDEILLGFCPAGFRLLRCVVVLGCRSVTHPRLLDRVVSGASFLAGAVLDSNISHRRFVAVLCVMFKIKSNLVNPLCGALHYAHFSSAGYAGDTTLTPICARACVCPSRRTAIQQTLTHYKASTMSTNIQNLFNLSSCMHKKPLILVKWI